MSEPSASGVMIFLNGEYRTVKVGERVTVNVPYRDFDPELVACEPQTDDYLNRDGSVNLTIFHLKHRDWLRLVQAASQKLPVKHRFVHGTVSQISEPETDDFGEPLDAEIMVEFDEDVPAGSEYPTPARWLAVRVPVYEEVPRLAMTESALSAPRSWS